MVDPRVLAAAFRRKGADALSRVHLKHVLSLDLGWFTPAQAKVLLDDAVREGLLAELGETLRPTFDLASIEVPAGWRPADPAASGPPETGPASQVEAPDLASEVQAVQALCGGRLLPKTALAVAAYRKAVLSPSLLEEARREIAQAQAKPPAPGR
ncbi:MAG TPA: DUF2240 family protein [Candidatus Thermoplasmatota archaeon]|nr:DUF2240 family protein [Candidatus Thermoplasmatota archaeon]